MTDFEIAPSAQTNDSPEQYTTPPRLPEHGSLAAPASELTAASNIPTIINLTSPSVTCIRDRIVSHAITMRRTKSPLRLSILRAPPERIDTTL